MKKRKLPSQSHASKVLLALAKITGYSLQLVIPPSKYDALHSKFRRSWRSKVESKLEQEIYYLKRRGYLRMGEDKSMALTEEGLARVLSNFPKQPNKLSGKHFILVIFDVPEKYKRGRDNFRYFLNQLGFTKLQKSVWLSHYDVLDELQDFIKVCDIGDWINVFMIEKPVYLPRAFKERLK